MQESCHGVGLNFAWNCGCYARVVPGHRATLLERVCMSLSLATPTATTFAILSVRNHSSIFQSLFHSPRQKNKNSCNPIVTPRNQRKPSAPQNAPFSTIYVPKVHKITLFQNQCTTGCGGLTNSSAILRT